MKKLTFKKTLAVAAVFTAVSLFYIFCHCPFKWFFGIPCPGCGMLRAFFALLRLDFSDAFYYHPLVFLMIPVGVYCVLNKLGVYSFKKNTETVFLVALAVAFAAVYILRLTGDSSVVKIDLNSSVLHKIITLILEALNNG